MSMEQLQLKVLLVLILYNKFVFNRLSCGYLTVPLRHFAILNECLFSALSGKVRNFKR